MQPNIGWICARICSSDIVPNGHFQRALLMGLRYSIERSPPSLLGHKIAPEKRWSPACSLGLALSLLFRAGCKACLRIRAFRGNVRDCATPLKQGGQRLNWRAYQCSIMLSNQSDILGIVFHALRNWHISFRGLDVGIAGECCTAITRESSGSGSEAVRAALYWLSEEERALLRKFIHFNEHTLSTNVTIFETAYGLPHWP